MNIAAYYRNRKPFPGLTRAEALILGIPFPLKSGWLIAHGATELTRDQEEALARVHVNRRAGRCGNRTEDGKQLHLF